MIVNPSPKMEVSQNGLLSKGFGLRLCLCMHAFLGDADYGRPLQSLQNSQHAPASSMKARRKQPLKTLNPNPK